jgi:hypothetical protein
MKGSWLQRLAAAFAGALLGLDGEGIAHLRQRVTGAGGASQLQFQLKLRSLSEHQGPLAVALVHKLYPPTWVVQQSARKDAEGNPRTQGPAPMIHRQCLIDALTQQPEGVMQRLVDAAANPDPDAMAKACKEIDDATPELKRRRSELRHALSRLQGHDYEPAHSGSRAAVLNNAPDVHDLPATTAYAGAPAADEALRWLRSKAQASAQPMPER